MSGIDFSAARAPQDIRLYAIGDVHGRFDLLRDMHGLIRADLDHHPVHDWRIIHLGDYIDRVVRNFVKHRDEGERFAQWAVRADEEDLR